MAGVIAFAVLYAMGVLGRDPNGPLTFGFGAAALAAILIVLTIPRWFGAMAVLGVCFRAFGYSPAIGGLVVGYLIGQLGGNLPMPGGIGGVDLGLIGVFTLYHQPLAVSTAAVLIYHAISLWVPGLIGSVAFVQPRRTLRREVQPAAMCSPLAAPIETVPEAAGVVG